MLSLRSSERGLKYIYMLVCVNIYLSLRSSERGLKSKDLGRLVIIRQVAPFVGAWIEIKVYKPTEEMEESRSVRRSVD